MYLYVLFSQLSSKEHDNIQELLHKPLFCTFIFTRLFVYLVLAFHFFLNYSNVTNVTVFPS